MSIPKYEDIGKRSSQILSGFYDTGSFSIKAKSKECGNEIILDGRFDETWRASFGSKIDVSSPHGFQLQQKFNTDNVFFGEVALCDWPFYGTRIGLTGSMQPASGELGHAWTANIIRNMVRLDIAMVHEKDSAKCNNALVMKFKDFLVGYQFSGFNHHEWLQNGNICVGYANNQMEAAIVKGGKDYVATINSKTNPQCETAIKITFDGQKSNIEMGCVMPQGAGGQLMAKVDSKATLSVGCAIALSQGFIAKLWTIADGQSKGGLMERCKFGVGLECDM